MSDFVPIYMRDRRPRHRLPVSEPRFGAERDAAEATPDTRTPVRGDVSRLEAVRQDWEPRSEGERLEASGWPEPGPPLARRQVAAATPQQAPRGERAAAVVVVSDPVRPPSGRVDRAPSDVPQILTPRSQAARDAAGATPDDDGEAA